MAHSPGWLGSVLGLLIALAPSARALAAPCPAPTGDLAKDDAMARGLFDEALRLEPARPEEALETLRCVDRLAPKPAVALRMGTIAERLGQRAMAADEFERYLERAGDSAPDAVEIRQRIGELRAPGSSPAPPLVASGPSSEDSSTQSLAGWVLAGSGIAFVVAGAIVLGVARSTSDSVHDLAPGTVSWDSDEARGRFETAQLEQSVGLVGLIVGTTVGVLGIVLVAADEEVPMVQATAVIGDGAGGRIDVRF